MSFQNHIKQVAPRLSQIKSRQPAMLLGNKVIVAGIGGNFIPGAQSSSDSTSAAVADISAGYITVSDSVVTLHDITKGTTSIADKIYIPDTGVEEPDYTAGGTPQPVPGGAGVVDVYKVTSTSPLTGVKATQYQSDTWQFQSQSISLIADPENTPIKDYIYIASGTQIIGTGIKSLSLIPTEGLVFYFNMNDTGNTAVDSVNGLVMTKHGGMQNSVPGRNKTCWQANQQGDYLSGTQTITQYGISYSWTLNLWINPVYSAQSGNNTIFQLGCYPNGFGFYMDDSRKVSVWFNQIYNHYSDTAIPQNTWTMLTAVKNTNLLQLYINGQLQTSLDGVGASQGSTAIGAFSRAATGGLDSEYFTGKLDQIAFWNYAMTQQQIIGLKNRYK